MGKSLKGKELGKGITQRRDGLYQISITKFKKRITLYAKTEEEAWEYLFRSVTTGVTFGTFEAEGAPFGRDFFYERLRRFYWILDKKRS